MEYQQTMEILEKNFLCIGAIVRVPFDTNEDEANRGDFRNFYLGTLISIDIENSTATVNFLHSDLGKSYLQTIELPIKYLQRCKLPENTPFSHYQTKEKGIVLCCEETNKDLFHSISPIAYLL